jgi:hypothetical protein
MPYQMRAVVARRINILWSTPRHVGSFAGKIPLRGEHWAERGRTGVLVAEA